MGVVINHVRLNQKVESDLIDPETRGLRHQRLLLRDPENPQDAVLYTEWEDPELAKRFTEELRERSGKEFEVADDPTLYRNSEALWS